MNRKERRRLMQQGEAVPTSDQKAFNVSKARVRAAEKKATNGDADGAIALLKEALQLDPQNARAHHVMAMIDFHAGRLDEARDGITQAATYDNDDPELHANCAAIMNVCDRPMEAEAAARHAIELAPDMAEGYCNLGVALEAQGKYPAARDELMAAIQRRPGYIEALISLGNLEYRLGDYVASAEAFAEAVRAWPANAMARTNLAIVLRHLGELETAEQQCMEAIAHNQSYAEAHNALGNIKLQLGDLPGAIRAFSDAIARRAGYPEAKANLAGSYFKAGEYQKSEDTYIDLLESHDTFAEAAHGLGVVLLAQGKVDDAEKRFRRAVELRPTFGEAWMNIADAKRADLDDADFEIIQSKANDSRTPIDDRIALGFALATVEDARGDYAAAWDAAQAANTRRKDLDKKADRDFDPAGFATEIDHVIGTVTKDMLDGLAGQGDPEANLVFVCGMPRSGTSLVEQMIAAHPSVHGAGEVDILSGLLDAYPDDMLSFDAEKIRDLADAYVRRLATAPRDGLFVSDKTPINVFFLGLAQVLFPNAKVIHCTRHPKDVALSCYFQNFKSIGMNWSNNVSDIAAYMDAERKMMAHWRDTLSLDVMSVDYQEMVNNPRDTGAKLIEFLGLPWDEAVASPETSTGAVLTASNWQVRKPIYKSAVDRWKNYETNLAELSAG